MAYSVKSTTSYGKRVSNSFKGILVGIAMFIIGTVLLFWNEGRFVKTQKALQEAEGATTSVGDVSSVDPALNGKLIHASAFADTKDVLTDGMFGVSAVAIALDRKVEYYQYEESSHSESRDKIGGGEETITTYTYKEEWVGKPVDSASFEDPEFQASNTVLTTVDGKKQTAKNVTFGAYKLPDFLVSSIRGSVPAEVALTAEQMQEWVKVLSKDAPAPAAEPEPPAPVPAPAEAEKPALSPAAALAAAAAAAAAPAEQQLELALDSAAPAAVAAATMVHVAGNVVYFGKNPNSPQNGDLRITLTKILPADVSILAKVVGSTFEEFTASNGKKVSGLSMGTVSAENMYQAKHSANSMTTWILRIVGVLLVIGGLKSIFGIFVTLLKVLPFLASIADVGVGMVCGLFGFAWSLLVISIAWLTYRPLIGIPLVVAAIALIVYLKKIAPKNNVPAPASE